MSMELPMSMNMTNMGTTTPMSMMGMKKSHMWMWFHTVVNDTVLFKSWYIDSVPKMVGSCIGIFILSILFEGLKVLRLYLEKNSSGSRRSFQSTVANYKYNVLSEWHALQTFLYALQTVIGYVLMLVVMTFSFWLCLAVTLGMTIGYYFFGDRIFAGSRRSSDPIKTCC